MGMRMPKPRRSQTDARPNRQERQAIAALTAVRARVYAQDQGEGPYTSALVVAKESTRGESLKQNGSTAERMSGLGPPPKNGDGPDGHDVTEESPEDRALMQEISMRLECVSCHHVVQSPIQQCNNGHLLCSFCLSDLLLKSSMPACPSCSVQIQEPAHNVALEDLAKFCIVPCRYEKCEMKVKHVDLARHIRYCMPSWKGIVLPKIDWKDRAEKEEKGADYSNMGSVTKNILNHLTCHFCNEIAPAPVTQCNGGHILCSICLGRLRKASNPICPSCSVPMQHMVRNVHLEEMVALRIVTCRHEGCRVKIKHRDLANHLESCEQQPVKCINCNEHTTFPDWNLMWEHYKEKHLPMSTRMPLSNLILKSTTVSKLLDGTLKVASWGHCVDSDGNIVRFFPGMYHCIQTKTVYFTIRMVGPLTEECYSLEVSSPGSNMRVQATFPAISYRVFYSDTKEKPCLAITSTTLKLMTQTGNGSICCQVTVAQQ